MELDRRGYKIQGGKEREERERNEDGKRENWEGGMFWRQTG